MKRQEKRKETQRKMKRLLSLFLMLTMLASLMAGCTSNTSDPSTETTEAATTASTTAATTDKSDDQESNQPHMLDGKKIIFIGNSYTYYGKTVLEKKQSVLTQSARSNDKGFFYQLCKANGAQVSVTNWTFGAHDFVDLFENCTANRGCDGAGHQNYLTDRNFDYVVLQQGSGGKDDPQFLERLESIMQLFREANPDVKFVFLVQTAVHNDSYSWRSKIKELDQKNVIVVDWGALVCDLINQKVQVPGGTEVYNKNSFIVCKSAADGYHPNMLTGYITTLMTYCAITGESAVGQDYSFCNDSSKNSAFNFNQFISTYYTYNNATTNFPAIFASQGDMAGIQQLVDQYLAAKAYQSY